MKKILIVALLALPLGGCNAQTVVEWIQRAQYTITQALGSAKAVIDSGCNILVKPGATPEAEVCVSKLRAGVRAVCNNSALLTDEQAGNYLKTVKEAVSKAQTCQ